MSPDGAHTSDLFFFLPLMAQKGSRIKQIRDKACSQRPHIGVSSTLCLGLTSSRTSLRRRNIRVRAQLRCSSRSSRADAVSSASAAPKGRAGDRSPGSRGGHSATVKRKRQTARRPELRSTSPPGAQMRALPSSDSSPTVQRCGLATQASLCGLRLHVGAADGPVVADLFCIAPSAQRCTERRTLRYDHHSAMRSGSVPR